MSAAPTNGHVLPIERLARPVVRFGVSCRVDRTPQELRYMRENAVSSPRRGMTVVPQYFWTADDRWFQAVDIRKVRRAPWWMRFRGADDLMIAEYSLRELPGPPDDWPTFYQQLAGYAALDGRANPEIVARARRELRSAVESSGKLVAWMNKYLVQTDVRYGV